MCSIINFIYPNFEFLFRKNTFKASFSTNLEKESDIKEIISENKIDNITNVKDTKEEWSIEIPSVDLKAPIKEGTGKETMDKFVGHFEETKTWDGNVCLAAHNRGYENNYFSRIKELKEGDMISYFYNNQIKQYIVQKNDIIKDTDLSCLEETQENKITLITCVENEPNYRRCVQAIENK